MDRCPVPNGVFFRQRPEKCRIPSFHQHWWDPISNHGFLRCGYNKQTSEYHGIYHIIYPKKTWGYPKLDQTWGFPLGSPNPNVTIPSQLPAANIWPSAENARHVTAAWAPAASRRIRVGSAEAKSQKTKPAERGTVGIEEA